MKILRTKEMLCPFCMEEHKVQIITTEVIETLQCGDFIQVLKSAYGISIDRVKVDDDYNSKLPTISQGNLPANIVTLLKQAIINLNNPARNDTEFSMFAFPALRALEGILKYNLTNCGIAMHSYNFNMFECVNGVYKLKPEFTGTISQDSITKLENCYNHLHNNRHTLFHFGIIIGGADANTRLLSSKAEADSIIRDTLKVIDENYIA